MKTHTHAPAMERSSAARTALPGRSFFRPARRQDASSGFFQLAGVPGVRVGRRGDRPEREADAVADEVVRGTPVDAVSPVQGGFAARISPLVQRTAEPAERTTREDEEEESEPQTPVQAALEEEEAEEEPVQAQTDERDEEPVQAELLPGAAPRPAGGVARALRAAAGGGRPLPPEVRARMEGRFGADFSGVRIHTDDVAVQLTRLLKARAFTHGPDIYFNAGRFAPDSEAGERLLAHELTHTVQQGAARARVVDLDARPDTVQREADADAEAEEPEAAPVQRQEDEEEEVGPVQREEDEEEEAGILIRPELLQAIRLARGEVDKVDAKKTDADGARVGWERLYDYFLTAFGGKEVIARSVIQYYTVVQKGGTKDAMPSWCGIFVWWAYKRAGIPIPDWKLGGPSILGWAVPRRPNELPRKGDIAYKGPDYNDHFALVSGVESPSTAEGKSVKSVLVATINGNTSGNDNLGGQIEEKWEPIGKWHTFFDGVAKLDLPDVPLVRTGVEPDFEEAAEPDIAAEEPAEERPPTDVTELETGEVATAAELPAAGESDVGLELPEPPAPVGAEDIARVEELSLAGSSEEAMVAFTEARPSQVARSYPALGAQLDEKVGAEQREAVDRAPVLSARTGGEIDEGLTPPDQIPVPADTPLTSGVTEPDPGDLTARPHENLGPAPTNEANEKLLDEQEEGGLLSWLRNNFRNFLHRLRTRDPGINTRAGERPNVELQGNADPGRMDRQREQATDELRAQRDSATTAFRNHPGQQNIQPREVHEDRTVELSAERTVSIETADDAALADYVDAPLPAEVRDRADELLAPDIEASLARPRAETEDAASARDADRNAEVEKAESEAARISGEADAEQRRIVVGNRRDVARHQKEGIENAYEQLNEFNRDADAQQKSARTEIAGKVRDEEGKARRKLDQGEADAAREKEQGEKEAAAKKKELDEAQEKRGWWDRAVSAVKKAVKSITSAIDGIFTRVRNAVKTIIEKAKNAAIGLINAARDWVVDKLNRFRDWAKSKVDKYLKDRFPGLADRINRAIDTVVDTAIDGVNAVADAAIEAVEKLADALAAALDRILEVFQTALKAAVQIAGALLTGDFAEALRVAVQAACDIAGIDSKPIFDFVDRAAAQILQILRDPKTFFNNVMAAIGGGVRSFAKNIRKHLINGLIGWLTGALSEVPIRLPETFDVRGIFSLVTQILGLTYENIKARIIKRFPPASKVFAAIEKGFAILKRLVTEGPAALWEEVKTRLADLRDRVLAGIRDYVVNTVAKQAITWLLSLLNPAAAIVKLLKLIFDFVMFLVQRFQQVKDFVMSVYESLTAIATGAIGKATQAVEDALARSLPVVIGLLASLAGLGGIGKTVKDIIGKISAPVNRVIDAIIDRVVDFAKKLLAKGKAVATKVAQKLAAWWKLRKKFKASDGLEHTIYFKGSGPQAVLRIQSEPGPFTRFLNWAGSQQQTPEQKKALQEARAIAAKIDDERRKPPASGTDEQKKKAEAAREKRVEALLAELSKHTALLFGSDLPPWEEPGYGSLNAAEFGTRMHARLLTRIGMDGKGFRPTTAAHTVYDRLNLRRVGGGGVNYYIRGHLLNEKLGGPGQWKNMTPLSRKGNAQHETRVESLIKDITNQGAIVEYKVVPAYKKRGDAAKLAEEVTEGRPPEDAAALRGIIESEDSVPSKLDIEAYWLERAGASGFRQAKSQRWELLNPVDRTAAAYHLAADRKFERVKINSLAAASPLKQKEFPTELSDAADWIWAAVDKRRKQPDTGPFHNYEQLAAETKLAAGRDVLTADEARQWRDQGFIVL